MTKKDKCGMTKKDKCGTTIFTGATSALQVSALVVSCCYDTGITLLASRKVNIISNILGLIGGK